MSPTSNSLLIIQLSIVFFLNIQIALSRHVTVPIWLPLADVDRTELISAGTERGKPYYVARTDYYGEKLPGKVWGDQNKIWFGYNGKEYQKESFEFLVYPRGMLTWVEVAGEGNSSVLPQNMFPGGTESHTGETYYICRGWYFEHGMNNLLVGKITRKSGICQLAMIGKDHDRDDFEVLVDNRLPTCTCNQDNEGDYGLLVGLTGIFALIVVVGLTMYFGWHKRLHSWVHQPWWGQFRRGNENII